MKVFLAAPFTSMIDPQTKEIKTEYRAWLQRIIHFLEQRGHMVLSSHVREEWGRNLQAPETALMNDFNSIKVSDLMIAYLGNPLSPGVQMELGIALTLGKRIVILAERGWGRRDAHVPTAPYLVDGLQAMTDTTLLEFENEEDIFLGLDSILRDAKRDEQQELPPSTFP